MARVTNKHLYGEDSGEPLPMKGQSGRSPKLPEWQSEVVMSLDGRSGVRFRRVKSHELVIPGDYIKDGARYEPWEGPRGFRAASFCKPVYRAEWTTHGTKE